MTNVIFAQPKCTLMALSPGSFIDPFFWDLASTVGSAYGEVFGELQTHRRAAGLNDFWVEPTHVELMIQTALSGNCGRQPQTVL
jgi:hypothetical protein